MKPADRIQLLLKEASIYQTHGLHAEAMICFKQAHALLSGVENTVGKEKIAAHIARQMATIKADAAKVRQLEKSSQLTVSQEQVVEKSMSGSDGATDHQAAFKIAANLMGFGQFNKALAGFDALLKTPRFRVEAGKNILRCQLAVGSVDMAVRQYHRWLEDDSFAAADLDKICSFLEGVLRSKGLEEPLARPAAGPLPQDAAPEEEAPFDVMAVELANIPGAVGGRPPVLDVTSQSGGLVSLIVPEAEKSILTHLKPGSRLKGVYFYTPEAFFTDDCVVSSRFRIDEGRRKGDFSVTFRLLQR
jgi:hypothetical protein